jgi:hypothetical protein
MLGMSRQNIAQHWVELVVTMILGIILLPIVIDQIQNTNTMAWNFTGHSGAVTLFGLIPFVFICGIIVYFIGSMLGKW